MTTLSLRGKSVLVTGGAGFIGSHLAERIARDEPARLVVVDNLWLGQKENVAPAARLLGNRLECFWEDATHEERLAAILAAKPMDVVFDLAVVPLPASLEKPMWSTLENVKLTTLLCELQRRGLFKTLVHFSSSEAYGTAQFVPITEDHPLVQSTPYAASKSAGDLIALSYAHTFGLDTTVLRPFNNYGPRQNAGAFAGIIPVVLNRVRRGIPIQIYGDGLQTRDYIFVTDTAEAAVRMYEEPATRGRVLNIGSGEERTVHDLVAAILEAVGRPHHPVEHVAPRPGDVRRHRAGVEAAEKTFGFKPLVAFKDGMQKTVEWYLRQPLTKEDRA